MDNECHWKFLLERISNRRFEYYENINWEAMFNYWLYQDEYLPIYIAYGNHILETVNNCSLVGEGISHNK